MGERNASGEETRLDEVDTAEVPRGQGFRLGTGLKVGVAVWIVGFAAAFVFAGVVMSSGSTLTAGIVLYFAVHLWGLIVGGGPGSVAGLLLAVVPIVATVVGGVVAASRETPKPARTGASIAVGYFAMTVLAWAVLAGNLSAATGIPPSLGVDTLVFLTASGIVQPAILGAVGGGIAG